MNRRPTTFTYTRGLPCSSLVNCIALTAVALGCRFGPAGRGHGRAAQGAGRGGQAARQGPEGNGRDHRSRWAPSQARRRCRPAPVRCSPRCSARSWRSRTINVKHREQVQSQGRVHGRDRRPQQQAGRADQGRADRISPTRRADVQPRRDRERHHAGHAVRVTAELASNATPEKRDEALQERPGQAQGVHQRDSRVGHQEQPLRHRDAGQRGRRLPAAAQRGRRWPGLLQDRPRGDLRRAGLQQLAATMRP